MVVDRSVWPNIKNTTSHWLNGPKASTYGNIMKYFEGKLSTLRRENAFWHSELDTLAEREFRKNYMQSWSSIFFSYGDDRWMENSIANFDYLKNDI